MAEIHLSIFDRIHEKQVIAIAEPPEGSHA